MIILSNALVDNADEGCVKVAGSLTKRIKAACPQTTVVTYDRCPEYSDVHLSVNKLMLSRPLIKLLREKKEPVLFIPFPARMIPTALRVFILSLFAGKGLRVITIMQFPSGPVDRLLFRLSGAEIITLSRESFDFYQGIVGKKASYLRTGVDTGKFVPVDAEAKARLREKYGVAPGKKVVTHVGHLTEGRNIRQLLKLGEDYHVFLVVSPQTEAQRDPQLRAELEHRPYTNIIDTYLNDIQEIYQMSDAYLFPVEQKCCCIDVPLSALEAAACGVPVVATRYGELREFEGKPGFCFIDSFEPEALDKLLQKAISENTSGRAEVMGYDWSNAVNGLLTDDFVKKEDKR